MAGLGVRAARRREPRRCLGLRPRAPLSLLERGDGAALGAPGGARARLRDRSRCWRGSGDGDVGAALRARAGAARRGVSVRAARAPPERRRRARSTRHYLPIRADAGEVVGVAAIVRDVTEEERIRQELRETDARFRNMADASPVLLWMSRTDGLCTFFNQTWLEFTGRTLEEEWGVGWAENVHFEDFEGCIETYRRRLQRAPRCSRWSTACAATTASTAGSSIAGRRATCPTGASPATSAPASTSPSGESWRRSCARAIEARDDFLSVASHELGTPLTALRLHVEQLHRAVAAGDSPVAGKPRSFERRVGLIAAEVQRLSQLVATLLDRPGSRSAPGGRSRTDGAGPARRAASCTT